MKKALVILILITYSFATMGTTMHLHYCMNEYVGASLWDGDDTSECGKCGMKEKKGGCCKDEHKAFKLKTDHQKSSISDFLSTNYVQIVSTSVNTFTYQLNSIDQFTYSNYHPPPNIHKQSFNVLYCTFLI